MKIGYASGCKQPEAIDGELARQRSTLREAGCAQIFEDRGPPEAGGCGEALEKALLHVTTSDVLVVSALARLGRTPEDIAAVAKRLVRIGAHLNALADGIDTTAPGGAQAFRAIEALGRLRWQRRADATRAGIQAAKAKGVRNGRRAKLSSKQIARARQAIDGGATQHAVAKKLGVADATLLRALRSAEDHPPVN